jgi:hypothetical protein
MAGGVIDRYITPEHLSAFFGYRRKYRDMVPRPEPPTALAGTWLGGSTLDRFASFYKRVDRAVFYSPTHFEIVVVDKYNPERRYMGTLRLIGLEWKLTALAVSGAGL